MKKFLYTIITGCLIAFLAVAPAYAAPLADCAYATVAAAVAAASDGDTVECPADTKTWATQLEITKAIILKGAGAGSTNITGTIKYAPTTPDAAHRFRLTGFTLNNGGADQAVTLYSESATAEYVRIDHNAITTTGSYRAIYAHGTIFGVVDNNTFTTAYSAWLAEGHSPSPSNTNVQWANLTRTFGSADNLYFEDNTVTISTQNTFIESGQGGRYAVRYNDLTSGGWGQFDIHGNQPTQDCIENTSCGNSATMMAEIYGNDTTRSVEAAVGNFIDARGGQSLGFFNKINTTTTSNTEMAVREEYTDNQWPTAGYLQHVTNSYYWANWNAKTGSTVLVSMGVSATENCCNATASAWQSEHLYRAGNDYYCQKFTGDAGGNCWKLSQYGANTGEDPWTTGASEPNWAGTAVRYVIDDGHASWLNMGTGSTPLAENTDFWTQKTGSFDGTGSTGGGVGCGTLAARPATCTTGVGYWATDQSCSDMTGLVGATPATPLSGTLYKCTATNTWTAYYQPYSYPHPIRGETTTRTVTSSKVGTGGTLSYQGASVVNDGDNSQIYTATAQNGYRGTWSGTCGATGTGSTYQKTNVTADCTVVVTFETIKIGGVR